MIDPEDARAPAPDRSLPELADRMGRIGEQLFLFGRLGLLTVTVLQRERIDPRDGWRYYDAAVQEVGDFLLRYRDRQMRVDDLLLDLTTNGNAFVILLSPPRRGRPLEPADLERVRARLKRRLRLHLARRLQREICDAFGAFVGTALLRNDPAVRLERSLFRALDSAFADALDDRERDERQRSSDLERILNLGLVRSVYQPVLDIVERRVLGYEALTRVSHVRFETVDLLFRAAQAHDALWSLERLCRRRALERAPRISGDQVLFLNVESEAIHDPELAGAPFRERLERAGLSAGRVVLELTEHSEVRDFVAFRRTLNDLRCVGFRLALDDVGSGYASLKSVAEIAPDFIKMDMTLVRDVHLSAIKRELLATIVRFADSTGIELIAEGVENREEMASLIAVGVRRAQGYLFAVPDCPPREPDWIRLAF